MTVEVGEDRLLADERLFIGGYEDRDRGGAGALAQEDSVLLLDRHLPGDVVGAELGQPLPHASRGRAPLGLPELVHQAWPKRTSGSSRSSQRGSAQA